MCVCGMSAAVYNSLQKYLMEIASATNVQLRYLCLLSMLVLLAAHSAHMQIKNKRDSRSSAWQSLFYFC